MNNKESLNEPFRAFEKARERIHKLVTNRSEGWQKEYATARKELESRYFDLHDAMVKHCRDDTSDPARRYLDLLESYKRMLDNHQARWPVIILTRRDPAYTASVADLDNTYFDIVQAHRNLMKT